MSHTKVNNYEIHCTYERTNPQCRHTGVELEAPPRKRPRGDLWVPVTDVSPKSQFSVSRPRGAGIALATREVSVGNATASSVSRQGQGVCSMAVATMSQANKSRGHTSDDLLRTLVRPEESNLQYINSGSETLRRKRPRGDRSVPVTGAPTQGQLLCVSGPRWARTALATEGVCVGNETASSVSVNQGQAAMERHACTEQVAAGVSSDSGKPQSSCSDDQRWKVQQSAGKGLILRTSASRKSRGGLCLRN